jgi:hypothetical protein
MSDLASKMKTRFKGFSEEGEENTKTRVQGIFSKIKEKTDEGQELNSTDLYQLEQIEESLDLDVYGNIEDADKLYSFSNRKGTSIKPGLTGDEAQAIFDLVNSHEGARVNNGANLLVTSKGKKLFETDADGIVLYSIAQHDNSYGRRQSPLGNSMDALKSSMQSYGAVESHTKNDVEIIKSNDGKNKSNPARTSKIQESLDSGQKSSEEPTASNAEPSQEPTTKKRKSQSR